MRILIVSNKVRTFSLGYQNTLSQFKRLKHDLVWAADFSDYVSNDIGSIPARVENIPIETNPCKVNNVIAYKKVLEIIHKYKIEGIYCTTPIGGAIGRVAGLRTGVKPIVYSAHGFLFFKGAPIINQTVYKAEEYILAHCTDAIITITKEDFQAAQKLKLRSHAKPYLVHGAGVNIGVCVDADKNEKRKELGVPKNALIIVSAGELNKNKNNETIIKAISSINNKNIHYLVCGVGPEEDRLKKLSADLKVDDRIHFMGFRTDIAEIMHASDIFTMMSYREGVPRALLEAMDLGLPCVGSDTRGIRDLIDSEGGVICKPNDYLAFAHAFEGLYNCPEKRKQMGEHNKGIVKEYSSEVVKNELYDIFDRVFR